MLEPARRAPCAHATLELPAQRRAAGRPPTAIRTPACSHVRWSWVRCRRPSMRLALWRVPRPTALRLRLPPRPTAATPSTSAWWTSLLAAAIARLAMCERAPRPEAARSRVRERVAHAALAWPTSLRRTTRGPAPAPPRPRPPLAFGLQQPQAPAPVTAPPAVHAYAPRARRPPLPSPRAPIAPHDAHRTLHRHPPRELSPQPNYSPARPCDPRSPRPSRPRPILRMGRQAASPPPSNRDEVDRLGAGA